MTLQWHYSDTSVTLQWHYSGTTVTLQWHYSDTSVTLQWHYSDTTVLINCETWILTLRSSDLQSDSDLDSIRNSCDVWYQNGKGNRACWILLTPGNISSTIVLLLGFLTMERVMPKMKKSRWHITIHIRRQKDDLLSVFLLKLKDVNWNETTQKTGWTNYPSFLVLSGL